MSPCGEIAPGRPRDEVGSQQPVRRHPLACRKVMGSSLLDGGLLEASTLAAGGSDPG